MLPCQRAFILEVHLLRQGQGYSNGMKDPPDPASPLLILHLLIFVPTHLSFQPGVDFPHNTWISAMTSGSSGLYGRIYAALWTTSEFNKTKVVSRSYGA